MKDIHWKSCPSPPYAPMHSGTVVWPRLAAGSAAALGAGRFLSQALIRVMRSCGGQAKRKSEPKHFASRTRCCQELHDPPPTRPKNDTEPAWCRSSPRPTPGRESRTKNQTHAAVRPPRKGVQSWLAQHRHLGPNQNLFTRLEFSNEPRV